MKIEFLKEYKFYLPDNTRKMWNMKAGSKFEHGNEALLNKWIARGVAKLDEPEKVQDVPEVTKEIEVAMVDVEETKETKPVQTKRRSRKAK